MAVLACWLGLSLLVRAPRDRAARAFAWLCLNLALYGLTIAIGGIQHAEQADPALRRLQLVDRRYSYISSSWSPGCGGRSGRSATPR